MIFEIVCKDQNAISEMLIHGIIIMELIKYTGIYYVQKCLISTKLKRIKVLCNESIMVDFSHKKIYAVSKNPVHKKVTKQPNKHIKLIIIILTTT